MRTFGLQNISIKDVLISVLILIVTFGYFLDRYIPKDVTEVNILGITVGSFEFEDILNLVYFSKVKILIIIFSAIWFLTSRHWWRYSILVIISIELLKLFSTLNSNQKYFDNIEYYTSLPITLPIILLMLFISKRINRFNVAKNLSLEIDTKIDTVFFEINNNKIDEIADLQKEFLEIKEKFKTDKSLYIKKLITMRDEFYEL